jgi:hypothetical protein
MAVLRIGAGNVYVANKTKGRAVAKAVSLKCHSWGWSEGTNLGPLIRRRKDYHALWPMYGFKDMRDATDCPMMLRRGLPLRHFSMTQVSDDSNPTKIAHDRVFSVLAYKWNGLTIAHIQIHPNAVNPYNDASSGVVKEFVKSMIRLDRIMNLCHAMGWVMVVTGDFNLSPRKPKPYLTMYDLFKKRGMLWRVNGVDGIAWDNKKLRLVKYYPIKAKPYGSDHTYWTVADFAKRAGV